MFVLQSSNYELEYTRLKICYCDVAELFKQNDIIVIQESWLRTGQELSLLIPEGFNIWSSSHSSGDELASARGGVVFLLRHEVHADLVPFPAVADVLVLETPSLFLIAAYVVPVSSEWWRWTDINPMDSIERVLSLCKLRDKAKTIILSGDLNGQTGSINSFASVHGWWSADTIVNAQGRWILNLCNDYRMTTLNGTRCAKGDLGKLTCFQVNGCSIIDYAIVSFPFYASVRDNSLEIVDFGERVSDHAYLRLLTPLPFVPTASWRRGVNAPINVLLSRSFDLSPLDMLNEIMIESARESEDAVDDLYGRPSNAE